MKQTVEEAANEFADREYEISDIDRDALHKGFYHGAKWQAEQSPWIRVEERLPDREEYDWVLAMLRDKRDGFIGIPQMAELRDDGFWHTVESDSMNTRCFREEYKTTDALGLLLKQEVISWMPIPSFDQILEANKDVLQRMKGK